jgi:hypothetical protein
MARSEKLLANTALPILCDAEVNFGAAAKPGGSKEFRMIEA